MDWRGDAEARLLEYINWSTFAFAWSYGVLWTDTTFLFQLIHLVHLDLLTLSDLLTRVPEVTDYGVCPLVERLFMVR